MEENWRVSRVELLEGGLLFGFVLYDQKGRPCVSLRLRRQHESKFGSGSCQGGAEGRRASSQSLSCEGNNDRGAQNSLRLAAQSYSRNTWKFDRAIPLATKGEPSRQRLLRNCYSACGDDGAFQDDGEATNWSKPVDPGEQERTDEDDHRDMKRG